MTTTLVESPAYKMSISLNVLNHLGIGLYSNIPAVLSEIVANAWDADATEVRINIDTPNSTIVITDNGKGMTKDDINNKYLMVGYSRRVTEPGKTELGRSPMGRKGIGKLSVFSIADIVEVYSVKDGQRNALLLDSENIQQRIKGKTLGGDYFPSPIDTNAIDFQKGTKIVLRKLKKQLDRTEGFLRKRLARRFSVIGSQYDFRVWVDDEEICTKDRDYFDALEFLWYMGDESKEIVKECGRLKMSFRLDNVVNEEQHYSVKGWIGTADERKHIDDQNNSIVIYAHGKLIQEDILKDFSEGGVYAKYLIGEIDADFMDLDDQEDLVTSDRQRVKEDDPRYIELKDFIWAVLKKIQNQWTNLRSEIGVERATANPIVKEWYDKWHGDTKTYAKKLFGRIESLKVPDQEAKKELYKSSMLAFEKMALKDSLSILDTLESEKDFELIAKIFAEVDELEAVHYYEIVKGRLSVVREFERILPVERERVLQQHIFDHLWLLDPSWERASSNFRIEQAVTTEFNDIDAHLKAEEREGRIDIRYKTAAGKHIIIELKKYNRPVEVYDLLRQVRKYRDALDKCLRTKFQDTQHVIECICILGSPPEPRDQERENTSMLKEIGARFVTYDALVQQTLESYKDYLEKEKVVSALTALMDRMDTEFV
jgi:hypothetical protein